MSFEYLHTMVRVENLDKSMDFYCNKLGLVEVSKRDYEGGRFTLIFLAAPNDVEAAKISQAPMLELTYNWPDENRATETYGEGRNFGHLAYRVDNIYDMCQKLMDAGVTISRPPRDGHMAFLRSPDNISIELLQRGESLPAQEPWANMKNTGEW